MKRKSKGLLRTALFVITTMVALVALRFVPAFSIGSFEVKPVDILSSLFSGDSARLDSLYKLEHPKPAWHDSCPQGMVCIDDYAPDYKAGMGRFYAALAQRNEMDRPVRVAYLGDSFIEGDLITADLRILLQKHFGGKGVGWVDVASDFVKYRATLHHSFGGMHDHCVLNKGQYVAGRLGLGGRYATADSSAWVMVQGTKHEELADSFDIATVYIYGSGGAYVTARANDGESNQLAPEGSGAIRQYTLRQQMGKVRFGIGSGATCLGMALESQQGVIVDNFSLRGSSGMQLLNLDADHLRDLAEARPYDLIVLQYGTNVAAPKQTKFTSYKNQMLRVIERLREGYPDAAILVVGIPDRAVKINGEMHTMTSIPYMLEAQQDFAAEGGAAFWNLWQAMGGNDAIVQMANASPSEAAKDYTHINRRGARKIATLLYNTLLHGYEQYQKHVEYDEE